MLLIISIVPAMAAPSLSGFASGRQPADVADNILALTRWAQSQSISQGQSCRLNLDPKTGSYWLTIQDQGAYVSLKTDMGETFQAPQGVTLALWRDQDPNQPALQTSRGTGGGFSMNQTGGNQFGSGGLGNGLNPSLSRTSANSANQSANPYVQFYPNGRCDVVTIEVTGQTGEKYPRFLPVGHRELRRHQTGRQLTRGRRATSRKAFTLVEILATLALIAIVMPTVMGGISLSLRAADFCATRRSPRRWPAKRCLNWWP